MIKIVYDVDGVLNDLNGLLVKTLDIETPSRFEIMTCQEFDDQTKENIMAFYSDPDVFKIVDWMPGAFNITDIESTGKAIVYINSVSVNDEIRQVKYNRIKNEIPGINMNNVNLGLIAEIRGKAEGAKEKIHADIVVEDNYKQLMKYDSSTVKILIDYRYNKAENYGTTDEAEGIIRVQNLIEANSLVTKIVNKS